MIIQEIIRFVILSLYLRNAANSVIDLMTGFDVLTSLRLLIICVFFIATMRIKFASSADHRPLTIVANFGAIVLPLFFNIKTVNSNPIVLSILVGLGSLITLFSLINLRKCFDVLPVYKGVISCGPYSYVRHPIYCGHIFSLTGLLFFNFTLANAFIYSLILLSLGYRAQMEEKFLLSSDQNYQHYMNKVPYKFIPGFY